MIKNGFCFVWSGIWDERNVRIDYAEIFQHQRFDFFAKTITFQDAHCTINDDYHVKRDEISVVMSLELVDFLDVVNFFDIFSELLFSFRIEIIRKVQAAVRENAESRIENVNSDNDAGGSVKPGNVKEQSAADWKKRSDAGKGIAQTVFCRCCQSCIFQAQTGTFIVNPD